MAREEDRLEPRDCNRAALATRGLARVETTTVLDDGYPAAVTSRDRPERARLPDRAALAQAAAGSIDGSPSSSDSDSTVPSPSGSESGGSSPPRAVPAISSSPFASAGMKPDFIPK